MKDLFEVMCWLLNKWLMWVMLMAFWFAG